MRGLFLLICGGELLFIHRTSLYMGFRWIECWACKKSGGKSAGKTGKTEEDPAGERERIFAASRGFMPRHIHDPPGPKVQRRRVGAASHDISWLASTEGRSGTFLFLLQEFQCSRTIQKWGILRDLAINATATAVGAGHGRSNN